MCQKPLVSHLNLSIIDSKGVSLSVIVAQVDLNINLRSGDLFLMVVEEWKIC